MRNCHELNIPAVGTVKNLVHSPLSIPYPAIVRIPFVNTVKYCYVVRATI